MELFRFIKRLVTVTVICISSYVVVIEAFFYMAPRDVVYRVFEQDWINISQRVVASRGTIKQDTLYVGCSVAGQLLPFNYANQLTTTGATYPIGNYFLIKNAIEGNPNLKTVVYLSIPNVIGNRLSRERTYGYFVKPFYTFGHSDEISASEKTMETLSQNRLLPFCQFNSFKVIRIDDFNYSNGGPRNMNYLSDESMEWLMKIDSLCKKNKVKFHLASPPTPLSLKENSSDWAEMRAQVKDSPIKPLFDGYFQTIVYLEDSLLKDRLHWKDKYIERHGAELLSRIKASL